MLEPTCESFEVRPALICSNCFDIVDLSKCKKYFPNNQRAVISLQIRFISRGNTVFYEKQKEPCHLLLRQSCNPSEIQPEDLQDS